jgi:hypothetical protein
MKPVYVFEKFFPADFSVAAIPFQQDFIPAPVFRHTL